MVSSKSSNIEAKKASKGTKTPVKEVSKDKKPVVKKTAAKKVVTKTKVDALGVENSIVPTKENIDAVSSVLEIKDKNEKKKIAKKAPKVANTATKSSLVTEDVKVEKGSKASSNRNNRIKIKENVKKAQAKNFVSSKVDENKKVCTKCTGSETVKAWINGYKNMFNFKARTSRFEAWAFILLNSIFSWVICGTAVYKLTPSYVLNEVTTSQEIVSILLLVFFFAVLIANISLTVRRLHDTGNSAFKGFYKPFIILTLIVLILSTLADKYLVLNTSNLTEENYLSVHITNLLISVPLLITSVMAVYYSLKIMLVSLFYEEQREENEYGAPMYVGDCYKKYSIRYTILYFMFSTSAYTLFKLMLGYTFYMLGA